MSIPSIPLEPHTMAMLESEYGPITVPPSSLADLVNALLQRHVQGVKDARRLIDEHTPVAACD